MWIKQGESSGECWGLEGRQEIKAGLIDMEPLEQSLEGSERASYVQSGGGIRSRAKALR